jgi:hypothetical protein
VQVAVDTLGVDVLALVRRFASLFCAFVGQESSARRLYVAPALCRALAGRRGGDSIGSSLFPWRSARLRLGAESGLALMFPRAIGGLSLWSREWLVTLLFP